jgi:hypothetical protein
MSVACARKPDDAKISSDVQSKFSQDSGLSTKQLTVQANNGVVTLSGFVDNDAQRQAASRQAASVEGVREVVDNLQVGSGAKVSASWVAPAAKIPDTKASVASSAKNPTGRKSRRSPPIQDTSSDNSAPAETTANKSEPAPPPSPQDERPTPPPPPAKPQPQKVTIEQGTPVSIRLVDSIDSEKNQVGDTFHATLNAPLAAEGSEAIPAGTDVAGHIVDLKSAGKFKGQSLVVLQLDAITANGNTYNLQTDQYKKEGSSRGKNTAEKVGGGALIGGIIGAIAGGGKGAAIGTAAGAGVGGGAQAASKSQQIKLPSETVLTFTLQAPVTVIRPVDPNAGRQRLSDSQ